MSIAQLKITPEMRKFQATLRPYRTSILTDSILAIDPASISLGWAWFQHGILIISGEYTVPRTMSPHKRLPMLMDQLTDWTKTDVMVIEKMFRYNASLVWSVGATIVTIRPDIMIEMPVRVWQAFRDDDYEKSDQADAELIGKALIYLAKDLKV